MNAEADEREPITQTHIVGVEVILDQRQRQRCAWCGAVLLDNDLTRMAILEDVPGQDAGKPASFPVGKLLRITGAEGEPRMFEQIEPGEDGQLPDDACGKVSDEVTA